ncbi:MULTISPECIES: DUF2157 domain-containing protein [Cyanophyceae]|uniref:DUF2157 domain-containing protein n=1 Tax=Cyanophyceae TaxID=3028117 RepID=UPI00232C3410|nr:MULTISPECIES: DUF2157 domain-containing protein [Cyanophyceae]MDB9355875.1 DUF2157 domain-containing protein [Nodularia spumigena CS-587/03]MDB9305125.1 DUF2157 domain-containing protein [Nodularia spumigena CS-591/12]MDB9322579.1 DUF2157 domain-containing protein [Nodularia spumigena CS-591/07A]MDB9332897.1 DUF2157 domain-containing protein [Nodularia spumigena CS-591/04]MDB9339719.1 DUF2157 domain-containing protein [Nodularia spumigena CS-589/07]
MLDNFPQKLRREAQLWRDEGLISASQYQDLAQRYRFNNLEAAARDRFVVIVISIGSILLCLGIITFVAANWQLWSREVKFILMMSLFLSTSITGFYTWRESKLGNNQQNKQQQSKRILGESLLILSAFILGANIVLMAQIFNINGSTPGLFFAWGFGVLVMAYSLSLTSLGIMAIILIQIGYWIGRGEFLVSAGDWNWVRLAVRHMPLLSWLLFVPLAYFCRSRWIFALAALVFTGTLQLNLNPLPLLNFANMAPWLASFAFALPPALFWSYDDLLFPTINYRLFQPLARNLALIFFGMVFYALSFRWQWVAPTFNSVLPTTTNNLFMSLPVIDLGILSGLAVLQWLSLLRLRNNPPRREVIFTIAVVTTFLAFIIITPFWHLGITRIDELGSFIFNVLLAFLAFGLMREGLKLNNRSTFWGGMLLLTLQIISRAIEYDTDRLFQSLVFVLCGSALISAGLWFERRLPAGSNSNSQ